MPIPPNGWRAGVAVLRDRPSAGRHRGRPLRCYSSRDFPLTRRGNLLKAKGLGSAGVSRVGLQPIAISRWLPTDVQQIHDTLLLGVWSRFQGDSCLVQDA